MTYAITCRDTKNGQVSWIQAADLLRITVTAVPSKAMRHASEIDAYRYRVNIAVRFPPRYVLAVENLNH